MDLEVLLQIINLGEDQELECKSADGGLPNDIWETVSAFANTDGGYIILGVSEGKNGLTISGIRNPDGLLKNFWDNHNNTQKLNIALCYSSDVRIFKIETKTLVIIRVPRARPKQRPVYINNNPITGTFKRNFEGDYRCTVEEVRQMLRDGANESQDSQILENFDLTDIDIETLKSFRQRFSSRTPDHPWLALNDKNLLNQLGGWQCDRLTGKEGITLACLIMFGRERSILEVLPHYHLDYQEQLSHDPEIRWTYRLTLDGTWEPNLFNFYYRIYSRLVNDINVPFQLDKDATRRGETHVHEALRDVLLLIPSPEHYELSPEHYERLKNIAAPVRDRGRTSREIVEQIILELCSEHYLSMRTLAELLGKTRNSIRNHYVNPMLERGLLKLRYPEQKSYPQQAYKTVSSPDTDSTTPTIPK